MLIAMIMCNYCRMARIEVALFQPRKFAKKHGWRYTQKDGDICPDCAKLLDDNATKEDVR